MTGDNKHTKDLEEMGSIWTKNVQDIFDYHRATFCIIEHFRARRETANKSIKVSDEDNIFTGQTTSP